MDKLWHTINNSLKTPQGRASISSVITIIIALIAACLNVFSFNIQTALVLMAALLGLLAFTQTLGDPERLKAGETIERLENHLQRLNPPNNPPLGYRKKLLSLRDEARDAKDILIIAWTANSVLKRPEFFRDRIRNGANIRIAIINPDNAPLIESAYLVMTTAKDAFNANFPGTIGLVHELISDQFQVKVFDYAPTLDFVMIDGNLQTGRIIVEMVPYRVDDSDRPHLFITAKDNPEWFKYFHDICEDIWQNAAKSPHFSRKAESTSNTPEQPPA